MEGSDYTDSPENSLPGREFPDITAPRVAAVVGPTASGKTSLAIRLAKKLGGEVISCDSMQIYRGMDIGTAKPTPAEMDGVPHHLIDVCDPSDDFSAADYAVLAKSALDDILSRGKLPIFCGGTGLYLDAVLTGNQYSDAPADPELRASLLADAERYGADDLWRRLYDVDPVEAAKVHPNNVKRVARALEIFLSTGRQKSLWDAESRLSSPALNVVKLGLERPRDELYSRIDLRVDLMMRDGLLDEVEALVSSGKLPRASTAAQAIGYKELIDYLDGKCSLSDAVGQIKLSSRRYSKRQMTWFRRDKSVNWLETRDMTGNFEVIVNNALNLLT